MYLQGRDSVGKEAVKGELFEDRDIILHIFNCTLGIFGTLALSLARPFSGCRVFSL